MNRRGFFRGLLASAAIIPSVSTKTIVDLAANTGRPLAFRIPEASLMTTYRLASTNWEFPASLVIAGTVEEWGDTFGPVASYSLKL